jgi:hypothetical protein
MTLLSNMDSGKVVSLKANLTELLLKMPDEEFYDLVRKRVKLPILGRHLVEQDIENIGRKIFWQTNYVVSYQKQ